MIRIACALILVAMGLLLAMLVQTHGGTAIAFTFLGGPALGAGLLVYLLSLRRRRPVALDRAEGSGSA